MAANMTEEVMEGLGLLYHLEALGFAYRGVVRDDLGPYHGPVFAEVGATAVEFWGQFFHKRHRRGGFLYMRVRRDASDYGEQEALNRLIDCARFSCKMSDVRFSLKALGRTYLADVDG